MSKKPENLTFEQWVEQCAKDLGSDHRFVTNTAKPLVLDEFLHSKSVGDWIKSRMGGVATELETKILNSCWKWLRSS